MRAQNMTAATSQLLSTINMQSSLSCLTKKTVNQTMDLIENNAFTCMHTYLNHMHSSHSYTPSKVVKLHTADIFESSSPVFDLKDVFGCSLAFAYVNLFDLIVCTLFKHCLVLHAYTVVCCCGSHSNELTKQQFME